MPLDTGVLEFDLNRGQQAQARRPRFTLDPSLSVGAGLKLARETLGLSLDQVEELTRVRARQLTAIETNDQTQLPSRPFAIGYVRAYAKAVGLDADSTAARYRMENPSPDDALHSPSGVAHQKPPPNRLVAAGIGAIVLAVVGWNIFRHTDDMPRKDGAVTQARSTGGAPAPAATGPFHAGAPPPAPPEASIPAPYVTPGLDAATAGGGSADAAIAAAQAARASGQAAATNAIDAPTIGAPFVAQGAIYGPTQGASNVIIQARKSISLEVRGAGGVVYFARQLAAGEAYRVPAHAGLSAEVSNPASAELFVNGVSQGLFQQPVVPLKVG